ncbi:MAG: type 1 periplasmic-binding domain-containing protein [Acidimicrobiales bacterium]
MLVNIFGPAANSTVGVPSPAEQEQDYEQVIADTNAHGGVACRKLVAKFYEGNPADSSQQEQQCLNIIQSKPFAVIDFGGYTQPLPAKECFAVQGPLPYLGTGGLTEAQVDKYFPYLLSVGETADTAERDAAYALAARGFFGSANGFKKLGMIYRDCPPELPKKMIDNLHAVGVPDSEIVTYDVGCPSGFASPSDIQQAILKFKNAGVTHMTAVDFTADWTVFTKTAQQQGFKPKWGIPDEGQVAISKGNLAPDYDNIADAIAITGLGWGQDNTTLPLSPGTVRCNAIFKAANRPDVYHQQVGSGGVACSHIWTFKAAVEHEPSLGRAMLAQGLQNAGLIQISWPNGDNTQFRPGRNTAGGGFWRPLQFFRSCTCWKPIDPTFRPSFS